MSKMHKTGHQLTAILHACLIGTLVLAMYAVPVAANQVDPAAKGPVTNLPLPRYVSMKASEGNARRGPSLTHRIDWVFMRRDMPLRITAEHGHWRRVEDRDGQGGWIHYSLLSGARTVIVEKDVLKIHSRPDAAAPVNAALEMGVIARLGKCGTEWCQLRSGGFRGWAPKTHLWGVAETETRD